MPGLLGRKQEVPVGIRHDLTIPSPQRHRRFCPRKSMQHEIGSLRGVARRLEAALPDGFLGAAEALEAMERQRVQARDERDELQEESTRLRVERDDLNADLVTTADVLMLQEVGVYEYRHPMESAADYKQALDDIRSKIKEAPKSGSAVNAQAGNWTVNGNKAKGAKMVRDTSKLLLRAYNNEAETLVYKLRPFRLDASTKRLEQSKRVIDRLGAHPMGISIADAYHRSRIAELELVADWLAKKEQEKEEAKAERARLREEAKARKELEAERLRLIKEQTHYQGAIARLRDAGSASDEIAELESKLAEVTEAVRTVDQRAANTRAGYVYVISNVGSFGDRMVKIGMTRRLEPMDRVRELGDASVPFRYDLHALVFSEDAVALEQRLHERFNDRRVNLVNLRREFFYLTPGDVKEALADAEGLDSVVTEFVEEAEAEEWRTSETSRTHETRPAPHTAGTEPAGKQEAA